MARTEPHPRDASPAPPPAALPVSLPVPLAAARRTVAAAFLGWTLDAFDFFVMVFVFDDVAREFHVRYRLSTVAVVLTLGMRAVGALGFGALADRFGRRPVLMASIAGFSALEFASGLAPGIGWFFAARALFGVAMGGEWGIGASLAMESVPPRWRGRVSGVLQAGYPAGYLMAALLNWAGHDALGWRGMFMAGAAPALLVLYIRRSVPESPDFAGPAAPAGRGGGVMAMLRAHAGPIAHATALMAAFNFLSHGTQDLYPDAFLARQRGYGHGTVSGIVVACSVGAMLGGVAFGWWSQRLGRRRAMAAACACSLLPAPFWAYGPTPATLALAGFALQFCVQGAWGVVPAYLNEIAPAGMRATFPGFAYQLGNFLACGNTYLQTTLAERAGDFRPVLLGTAATAALALGALALAGREPARDARLKTARGTGLGTGETR